MDEMYERLKDTLNDYEVIICRWPEYTFALENVRPYNFSILHLVLYPDNLTMFRGGNMGGSGNRSKQV